MKKLVCDKCGFKLMEKEEVELALEGQEAWGMAVRARGEKPRGVLPCKHYIRCGGEMLIANERKGFWRRLINLIDGG
jgi:hypothetical protein